MALQNFVDKVGPVVSASWLNAVDILKETVFANATTKAAARTALTSDAPLEIANGGTGNRTGLLYPSTDVRFYGAVGDGLTDDTAAIQDCIDAGGPVEINNGIYLASNLTGTNVKISGNGTLKKLAATSGKLLELSGTNTIEGITIDYNWTNLGATLPYWPYVAVWQEGGELTATGVTFQNSLANAVRTQSGSLSLSQCKFRGGAPHNGLSGGNERVTGYVEATATSAILDTARILIVSCDFQGPNLTQSTYHLNPSGIFINAAGVDSPYLYKNVTIHGNTFEGCGLNSGPGNFTAPIDTYNGVENLSITGNTIRKYSYSGIKVQNSGNLTITGNVVEDGYSDAAAYAPGISMAIMVLDRQRSATQEKYNAAVTGNVVSRCSYAGIINSVDNVTISDNVLTDIDTNGASGHGIWNTGNKVKISENVITNHSEYGIYSTGDDVDITGNTTESADGSAEPCILFSGARYRVTGNHCSSASVTPTNTGIRSNGPLSYSLVEQNILNNLSTGINLNVASGAADEITLDKNVFQACGTNISLSASVTNVHAVTHGFTASVSDGGTITHGHPKLPTNVRVTTSVANEFASVTSILTATFAVAIKKHDGTAGTSQTIYWEAAD